MQCEIHAQLGVDGTLDRGGGLHLDLVSGIDIDDLEK